jgi:hypothetical protein
MVSLDLKNMSKMSLQMSSSLPKVRQVARATLSHKTRAENFRTMINKSYKLQSDLREMKSDSTTLPAPSSCRDMISDPGYLANVSNRLAQE